MEQSSEKISNKEIVKYLAAALLSHCIAFFLWSLSPWPVLLIWMWTGMPGKIGGILCMTSIGAYFLWCYKPVQRYAFKKMINPINTQHDGATI